MSCFFTLVREVGGAESVLDFGVEPKEEKRILDINVSWGRGMGFSDHY